MGFDEICQAVGTWVLHVQHEGHHVEQDIRGDKLLPVLDSVIAKQNHLLRYSRLRNELLHELAGLPANFMYQCCRVGPRKRPRK